MFNSILQRTVIESLYQGILGRQADKDGLLAYTDALRSGTPLAHIISQMLTSEEYTRHLHSLTQSSNLAFSSADIVNALYDGILGRKADARGLEAYTEALERGTPLSHIMSSLLSSEEYKSRLSTSPDTVIPTLKLPDLTSIYKTKYIRTDDQSAIFEVSSDDDFRLLETLILEHRYYDSFGVWNPNIDLDKKITAAIVQGLGARTCVELGCFSGPVLSLLHDQGIDVCGIEISHLAFTLAYPNIHRKLRYGTLLSVNLDIQYDVFLGMDILEHLNPLQLDEYVARIATLVKRDGFVYINSPMFGEDRIFGSVFPEYLPEWRTSGRDSFWRHIHCDAKGWPMHGHLVWAHPSWWENLFLRHGLVRDAAIENTIHNLLKPFFDKHAPARRSFFVLRHAASDKSTEKVSVQLRSLLSKMI